jgi:methane/ammonia monooxygenase subunit A
VYVLWWQFGKFFCTSYFYFTDDRQRTVKVYDVFAYATLAHGDKAKIGGKA